MDFAPAEFYEIAGRLYQMAKDTDQALIRTSIGRSYYSVMLAARDSIGLASAAEQSVHSELIKALSGIGDKPLANRIDKLRRERNHADYNLKKPCTRGTAYQSLSEARSVLGKLGITVTAPSKFAIAP